MPPLCVVYQSAVSCAATLTLSVGLLCPSQIVWLALALGVATIGQLQSGAVIGITSLKPATLALIVILVQATILVIPAALTVTTFGTTLMFVPAEALKATE